GIERVTMGRHQPSERTRQRQHQVVIGDRQQILLQLFGLLLPIRLPARGAMPVAMGVEVHVRLPTGVTPPLMFAHGRGASP
ncbi:MAG: hypothetical protein R6U98_10320, partial [Pirellulaceae bacterium]